MAFTLTIKTDNAAFGEDKYERAAEVTRILRHIADQLESDAVDMMHGTARDLNGNTVAEWTDTP